MSATSKDGRCTRASDGVGDQIERTLGGGDLVAADVRVAIGRGQAPMTEKALYDADVDAGLEQMRGARVAQSVRIDRNYSPGTVSGISGDRRSRADQGFSC